MVEIFGLRLADNSFWLIEHHGGNTWFLYSPSYDQREKVTRLIELGGPGIDIPSDITKFINYCIVIQYPEGKDYVLEQVKEIIFFTDWTKWAK